MEKEIKTHTLGKLRVYLNNKEKVKSRTVLRKLFPKNTYIHIIQLAKQCGIMNATVYTTHAGYSNFGKISRFSYETDNNSLTICIELIDTKERLQDFFIQHTSIFKDKIVVFKEVEFWDTDTL
jgi:PII-like signaling protein